MQIKYFEVYKLKFLYRPLSLAALAVRRERERERERERVSWLTVLVAAEPKEQTKARGIFTVDFMDERKEHFHSTNDFCYFFRHIVEVYGLFFGVKWRVIHSDRRLDYSFIS